VSELQHPDSRPFELVADVYERARPEYPEEAIAWIAEELDLREGRTVLDLGAGTGKLSRSLLKTGARVIAVEPGDAMRAELERAVPEAEALRGSAEQLPLADGSVDAITIGQAFHWFRYDEAMPELRRVLRPAGGVALLWNNRDQDAPLQREISELIAPFVPVGRASAGDSARHLAESDLFGPLEERRFRFVQARRGRSRSADRLHQLRGCGPCRSAGRGRAEASRTRCVDRRPGRVSLRDGRVREPRGVRGRAVCRGPVESDDPGLTPELHRFGEPSSTSVVPRCEGVCVLLPALRST
jgi:ubiquinone/menaquinone biosynthesis C-methylase UbiE